MKPINKNTKELNIRIPLQYQRSTFFDPEKILRWFWKGRSCSSLPFLTKERKEKRVCGKPIILENSVKTHEYPFDPTDFLISIFFTWSRWHNISKLSIEWNISKCIVFFGRSCCWWQRSKNNFEELWKYATSEITWGILKG